MSYKIKYRIKAGEFEHQDLIDPEHEGLTDAILFASIVGDGDTSTAWLSADGDGPMTPHKKFVQWGILAKELAEDGGLSSAARAICRGVFVTISQVMTKQERRMGAGGRRSHEQRRIYQVR
jgi:hypothetical protein